MLIPSLEAVAFQPRPFFAWLRRVSSLPMEPTPPTPAQALLEGHISVQAALHSGSREVALLLLREDKRDASVRALEQMAHAQNIPITRLSAADMDARVQGKTHGGVAATVGPRRFASPEALLPASGAAFIAMIDGVEDPFNFGQAVRCLWAAGAHGLVVRPRNWMSAAGVVARASAGASELIPTAIAETADTAAAFFRAQGLAIACADEAASGTVSLYDADLTQPLFLLIGGEKRGITRSFAGQADLRLRIPYGRANAHALGTASAAAILAFETLRQRSRTPFGTLPR